MKRTFLWLVLIGGVLVVLSVLFRAQVVARRRR